MPFTIHLKLLHVNHVLVEGELPLSATMPPGLKLNIEKLMGHLHAFEQAANDTSIYPHALRLHLEVHGAGDHVSNAPDPEPIPDLSSASGFDTR